MALQGNKSKKEASKDNQLAFPEAALGEVRLCPGLAGQDQVGDWIKRSSHPLSFIYQLCLQEAIRAARGPLSSVL